MITHLSISDLRIKEGTEPFHYTGLIATTHPDKVKDVLLYSALVELRDKINNPNRSGDQRGAYRSVSLYHDWIKDRDPTLDEVAMVEPTTRIVKLDGGHFGLEADINLNEYYKGPLTKEEIAYRIENGFIAGMSIEYDTNDAHCVPLNIKGETYRGIKGFTEVGGVGLARARKIANPNAVFYKEIEEQTNEALNLSNTTKMATSEELQAREASISAKETALSQKEAALLQKEKDLTTKEASSANTEEPRLSVKEILASKEFKDAVKDQLAAGQKPMKTKESDRKEEEMELPLSIKELNEAINVSRKGFATEQAHKAWGMQYKEAARKYFLENKEEINRLFRGQGIPLNPTLQTKCEGNQIVIISDLQVKDTLNQDTNTTAYTQNIVEMADVYGPGLIDTFNNQRNLLGAMPKIDNVDGSSRYGWRMKTARATGAAKDPDDPTINKNAVRKFKYQTDIKEYSLGVSVADYTAFHSRASIGDLFMIEVQSTMDDLMYQLNVDLYTEQVDTTGVKVLGLEAVADSAGNTSMYGLTRSTANRLAPDSAADTYVAVGGAITVALVRAGKRNLEVQGSKLGSIRFVTNPKQRDALFALSTSDANIRYGGQNGATATPTLGFSGEVSYDGIPMIIDAACPADSFFVVDFDSYKLVVSKAPQLEGLAKLGSAEEAFISTYVAAVYEQPRRIHQLDTLS